ncbi:hypothetical protein IC617_06785 [Neiella sp. HB171785]|uniref:Uncharacterized protein n=1 Tax=Neiella litorisoli TaxID=2771431 RepID=A0A8J6ULK4_9GAMM|nr:hypothetical protein [Neiella litorisoli]MBD1389130.1 hypothetical protein [Neiella litorisoli]
MAGKVLTNLTHQLVAGLLEDIDKNLKRKVDVVVGLSRLAGGTLTLIGCILVFVFVQAALDPTATIEINGVPTKDQMDKIVAVIFSALFPIFGLFLSFAPARLLDGWATKIIDRLS